MTATSVQRASTSVRREADVEIDEFDDDGLDAMEKEFPPAPQHRIMQITVRSTIAPPIP